MRHRSLILLLVAFLLTVPFASDLAAVAQGKPVRIAFPNGMNGLIVVTMEKAGIAKANGLDAEFSSFQNGPPMMEALASGSLEIGVTSVMPVVSYGVKVPKDIQVVAFLGHSSYALLVPETSSIQSAANLAGTKIGVSFGSDSHLDALIWLKEQQLNGKVTLVNVAPSELVTALANASVDAVIIRQPQIARLEKAGTARVLKSWPHYYVAVAKRKFIEENPEALAKFMTSLRQSILYIATHKEETAAWFGTHQRVDPALVVAAMAVDKNTAAKTLSDIDISVSEASKARLLQWAADALENKMIRTKLDPAALF